MPKPLYALTDGYYEEPVAQPLPVDIPRVVISGNVGTDNVVRPEPDYVNPPAGNAVAKLTGAEGERFQLWPEKIVREGLEYAGKVMKEGVLNPGLRREDYTDIPAPDMPTKDSTALGKALNIAPVAWDPQDKIIEGAQAMSALAGSGGLAGGVEGAALNATPSLRPALRYKDKLYKGKEGQQHLDVIPENLYGDFQKKAMSGDDIKDYNFGFIDEKGRFLTREKALEHGINTGLIDPQAGKYGALTSTLMADSSKPGTAIEAVAKTAPTFYSAVEHNVNAIPQSKMTGDQWLGTLANKPGVKGEELDWTGLKGFLEENKGKPVTKEQIQEHLASNKVELKEVSKGVKDPKIQEFKDKMSAKYGSDNWSNFNKLNEAEQLEFKHLTSQDLNKVDPTKYHSYQLPGAENYREMLLTLPNKQQRIYEWEYFDPKTQTSKQFKTEAEAKAAAPKDAVVLPKEVSSINEPYRSSHWDEPNILAHVRMNDRTIDGKKSLHVEEIQSDWHQQGRDKGYKDPEAQKKYDAAYKAVEDARAKFREREKNGDFADLPEINKVLDPLIAARSKASEALTNTIPDAPFKKTWHELALKRMLREAAEKGYDRLSWTPGEAQAARYDLSKSVDKIAVPMVNENGTRSVRIDNKGSTPFKLMVDRDGKVTGAGGASDQFSGKPLSDIVGKEMSDKIMKLDKPNEFAGDGLKIGGEGMKGFYDQMIPKALEKLGKEHGVKVKKGEVDGDKIIAGANKGGRTKEPVFYIDIPESLKNTALQKGFPLFSKGGFMLNPVDYEPEFK